MSRRESVGRTSARTQSSSGPPGQQMVSVAVLPPRLANGMAPPTGIGAAETFDWDERLNWRHNEPINEAPPSKSTKFRRQIGLTGYRKPIDEDTPPFVLRQVPYDTWRKHYAKDKDGNYHGTHAPAEDCLLKPEDVRKWRVSPMLTKGDQWTRGREALPVYAEAQEEGQAPEYEVDYTGPPRSEPILDDDGEMKKIATNASVSSSATASARGSAELPATSSLTPNTAPAPEISTGKSKSGKAKAERPMDKITGEVVADGKTAEQIIAEAKAKKDTGKMTWKERIKRGAEIAMMGN